MTDQKAIWDALEAIKKVSDSDLAISRDAITEIERQVGIIDRLAGSSEVRQEGQYLVSRALGRFKRPGGPEEVSSVIWSARLHGAVARYEFALRRAGVLPPATAGETQPSRQAPKER